MFTEQVFAKKGADVGSYDGRSLMLNSGSSNNLSHTYGSVPDSQKTFTFSVWLKRSLLGQKTLYSHNQSSNVNQFHFEFQADNTLIFIARESGTSNLVAQLTTSAVYRDVSGWLHIVVGVDTTQATASERLKLWVNNIQVIDFSTETIPAQNINLTPSLNGQDYHIGRRENPNDYYYDGYLADFQYLDGIAASPTDFGRFSADTGEWVPKPYEGSYGTNGFKLDFSDTTSFTTLGEDSSGNGNDFTLNNYSGTTTDYSVVDTPVEGYPVLNAIDTGSGTLSEGNLESSSTTDRSSTIGVASGKWAWSVTANAAGNFGVVERVFTGTESTYSASSSDDLEFELDMDAGTLDVRVNGASPTSVATGLSNVQIPLFKAACSVDFGQRGFTPTDSGFKALSTANMPQPKTLNPREYFTPLLYTGNGGTNNVTGAEFDPDWVWLKNRDQTDNHKVTDSVRGATNEIETNTTDAEVANADGLTSFDSGGFTLGADVEYNTNAEAYVAWLAKISALAGFDIQAYTGDGVAGRTVAHDLGKVPDFMWVRNRSTGGYNHPIYVNGGQVADPETDILLLNTTAAFSDNAVLWDDTAPTETLFTVGSNVSVNENGSNIIAYLFADDGTDTIYVVGSYTGNGNADGPFVYTRGRPQWVMLKRWDGSAGWAIKDMARSPYNFADDALQAESSAAEISNYDIDFLSNGFKCRDTSTGANFSGSTYIFIAVLESHLQHARAV